MSSNEYDQAANRRVRATRFEQVIRYNTALTVYPFNLQQGLYEIAAEDAEIYVIDGTKTSFDASQWGRIEAGDFKVWESRKAGDSLSVYLTTGSTCRITRRCQG